MENSAVSLKRDYPSEQATKVQFYYREKTYTGLVSDFWENGFQMTIEEKMNFDKDNEIPILFLGKTDKQFALQKMRVMNCQRNEISGMTIIDLFAPNPYIEQSYAGVIQALMDKPDATKDQELEANKLPSFVGSKHYSPEAVKARLDWTRSYTGTSLDYIDQSILSENPGILAGNIENYIGSVQIPIGIAGPIKVNGSYAQGTFAVPLATTEGALVSSVSRGAKACNEAGGVNVHVNSQRMLRAPVFLCRDMQGALMLEHWVTQNYDRIKAKAESVSSVAKLINIKTMAFGDTLHLQFHYTTADAAGQNMTTSCTWVACEWIAEQVREDAAIKYESHYIEGNMSGDKKINYRSFIEGRGVSVSASIYIPGDILKRVLKVSPDQYMRIWQTGEFGGLMTGMMGYNINFANVIAGIFTAAGQDIACVHESSLGVLKARKEGDGLLFNAHLPNLVIGTVGGGTNLPTQRECLEIMGCHGQGNVFKLAEIIAATCVALDLSTSSAIFSNNFVKAHEKLGRKTSKKGILRTDINNQFFNTLMKNPDKSVISFENVNLSTKSGLVTSLLQEKTKGFYGLFKYILTIKEGSINKKVPVVLKIKSDNAEINDLGIGVARLSGEDTLPGLFEAHLDIFGFNDTHTREIEFYKNAKPEILNFCPKVFGSINDDAKSAYAVLLEDLSGHSHLDTVNSPDSWDKDRIKAVLEDLAEMHTVYLNRFEDIPASTKIQRIDPAQYQDASDLLLELTAYNTKRYPQLIDKKLSHIYTGFIKNISGATHTMNQYINTLTHNDFNTRNICLGKAGDRPRLVAYDWELACYQNPQYDVIEFLIYALNERASIDEFDDYTEYYRKKLEEKSGLLLDKAEFDRLLLLCALRLGVVRFNLYLLVHNIANFNFMDRVYSNLARYISAKAKDK